MVLRVDDVTLDFDGLRALTSVSMAIDAGALAALVGPNGAGKTCLLNCVGGFYAPTSGRIVFGEVAIQGLPPHQIAAHGIARTFQFVELFRGMTVLDNILLGRHRHMRAGVLAGGVFWGRSRREETAHRRRVEEIIEFLELERSRKELVASLPFGVQKIVAIGRALAMEPKLLLLDEPMAGTGRDETERLVTALRALKGRFPMVLVEHDMHAVFALADRISVLIYGKILASGTPAQVRADPQVVTAYLGEEME